MDMTLNNSKVNAEHDNEILLRLLDAGFNDMELGKELSLEEAFGKIAELRNEKRNA